MSEAARDSCGSERGVTSELPFPGQFAITPSEEGKLTRARRMDSTSFQSGVLMNPTLDSPSSIPPNPNVTDNSHLRTLISTVSLPQIPEIGKLVYWNLHQNSSI